MADPTIKDVLAKLDALEGKIPKDNPVRVPNLDIEKPTEEQKKKQKEEEAKGKKPAPIPEDAMVSISRFKHSLIEQEPKILTERHLPTEFITKIDDMHKELVKHPVTEWLEAAGLGGFAAGFEKIKENTDWKTYVPYFVAAVIGFVLPVLGLLLATKFTDFQRWVQQLFSRGGRILAFDENGQVRLQDRTVVEQRERRIANGGTSVADLVGDPANAQQAETLAKALEKLNPQVERFEAKAPSFLNSFKRLPNKAKADKAVIVLGLVGDAIKKVNARKLEKIAEGLEKLNKELDQFQPTKLPTDTQLGNTADAMGNLAREAGTLREKFEGLQGSIRSLDQQIGQATGG
ncbi:hypothetical protein [Streptomyces sp. NPDC058486]|uniref:hypothetical protein n=1 Tax=unclassified Streptomyces TaxID=2593676 RepID=UPI0036685276